MRQCIISETVVVTTSHASRNAYSQHGASRASLNPTPQSLNPAPVPETVTALEVKSEVKEEAQAGP